MQSLAPATDEIGLGDSKLHAAEAGGRKGHGDLEN
jgi:hypothetical protein